MLNIGIINAIYFYQREINRLAVCTTFNPSVVRMRESRKQTHYNNLESCRILG